jgi:ribosomal protein L28
MCEICNKESQMGRSQQHGRGVAGRRWKNRAQETPRMFKPNLQKATLMVNNVVSQMKVCTKCLKRIKKYGNMKEYKSVATA